MPLRFRAQGIAIGTSGSVLTHGLTNQITGLAQAPTEWGFNFAEAAPGAAAGNQLYRTAAPTSTTFAVATTASNSGATDVFCSIPHSIMA